MPRFEIVYSDNPMGKALCSENIVVRSRIDAGEKAASGLKNAELKHGAKCYRVLDTNGFVVTRGP